MSAATQAKSAKARATIAARMLKTQRKQSLGRSFDDCFEMGDGDDVYLAMMARADGDPDLVEAIKRHGFGYWLEPDYRAKVKPRPKVAPEASKP